MFFFWFSPYLFILKYTYVCKNSGYLDLDHVRVNLLWDHHNPYLISIPYIIYMLCLLLLYKADVLERAKQYLPDLIFCQPKIKMKHIHLTDSVLYY